MYVGMYLSYELNEAERHQQQKSEKNKRKAIVRKKQIAWTNGKARTHTERERERERESEQLRIQYCSSIEVV